jgi:hypothetical protein
MVLVGHSQGGLLVKMLAINTGDRLWNSLSRQPLAELQIEPETRLFVERALFLEPLPSARRVIFIATPQRGSFIASNPIYHWVAQLATLPVRMGVAGVDLLTNRDAFAAGSTDQLATSIENMTPGKPFSEGLAAIPISPGIAAHSIIPVLGDGPVEERNDGVVEYASAHIEGVESELVIPNAPHSVQGHPNAIEEVRRILLLHIGAD